MFRSILFIIAVAFTIGCLEPDKTSQTYVEAISVPCKQGGESNLFVSETNKVYISWVEYVNDSLDELRFAKLTDEGWSSPKTIASGVDWFVNWADFPSLAAYQDDGTSLIAHWLQKSAEGTYDYDVRVSQSMDEGKTWSESFIPHRDSVAAEHGFVTLISLNSNQVFATWLDGRNTKAPDSVSTDHGHHGSMTLRCATIDRSGQLSNEAELDDKVCDCCQTDAVLTDNGILVAYRDRSDKEIRDISVVTYDGNKWSEPRTVYNDQWYIPGCPVNGPAVDALANQVVISWFTTIDEAGQVKVAFSEDGGLNFNPPKRIDLGNPLGRVDVEMLENGKAVISWMEHKEDHAEILIRTIDRSGNLGNPILISKTTSNRQSGFPIIDKTDTHLYFSWTAVDTLTSVRSARLPIHLINQ